MRALLPVRALAFTRLPIRAAASAAGAGAPAGSNPVPPPSSNSASSASSSQPVRPPRRRSPTPPVPSRTMKRGKGTIESFFPASGPKKARGQDPQASTKENVVPPRAPVPAEGAPAPAPWDAVTAIQQPTKPQAAAGPSNAMPDAVAAATADVDAAAATAAADAAATAAAEASTAAAEAAAAANEASTSAAAAAAAGGPPKQPALAFSKLMAASRAQKYGASSVQKQAGAGAVAAQGRQLSAEELTEIAERNTSQAQQAIAAAAGASQAPRLSDLLTEPSWRNALASEFDKPYMSALQSFVAQEWASHKVFPPQEFVFRAFNSCPIDQVRVVILGQDPYHNDNQAMGLSFSVPPGQPKPSSLQNIFKELNSDLGCKVPNHGSLEKWSHQGVLLLNASLTVRAHTANSHSKRGWESFTSAALKVLSSQRSGIVFLLWGKFAQDRAAVIDTSKHHVLKSAHPSGLSASRGFFGCKHFSKTNDLLRGSGLPPIDWQIEDVAR